MSEVIHARAFLSPFGHVAWTAIAAGALWRVKGERMLTPVMFTDPGFLKALLIPIMLHMIWNAPLPSPFYIKHLTLGVMGWFVVFGLVQQGLLQVRDEQARVARAQLTGVAAS
jgi:RsiW-degrading membrane proteinase PrsW (M82 family)